MRSPVLCETVTGRTMAELLAARDRAVTGDMVELRLDGVADLDVARALAGRNRPAIVTCRPTWEGGHFEASENQRRVILARALDGGAEYIDVEWRAGFTELIAQAPARVVVSSHDFAGVPTDLESRVRAMRQTGAAVIKIAVTAARLTDTLPLIGIGRAGGAVVIGMGAAGLPTRLLAAHFGSQWTYAGNAVAPGQIPAEEMAGRYRFRSVGRETRVFGVVSGNAMHSLSPTLHNAAFAAADLDAVYVPFQAAHFDDFLAFADALGVEGASVTIPFKLDALHAAHGADDLTRTVGAANTVRRRHDAWEATNTDVAGFLEPLEAILPGTLEGARAAVLGAGGAARAVVVALTSRKAQVTVHARRLEQAQEVAVLGASAALLPPAPGSWDVLVNTTPVGGAASRTESPLPHGPFTGRVVYDLTYGPGESRLVREARAAGCLALDGLPMLIAQAEHQFEWWTGQRAAPSVMAAAAGSRQWAVGSGQS
ncbi:MAG TPA: type I 3-dehydroquinate dehydratase [Vicinamibacterales bacterium]